MLRLAWGAIAVLTAGGAARAAGPEAADHLAVVEQQLTKEAELREALAAFPLLTLEEFESLPPEDLRRDRFVWTWAAHYRRARLGLHDTITSIGPEPAAARRDQIARFDPTQLKSGMVTDGATRAADEGLPAVLTPCAEAHEAVHERDLHAYARRLAREHAEQLLAAGRLMEDPGFVRARRELGLDAALDAFAEALFEHDLAVNRDLIERQRAAGHEGPVRMAPGPLRDANVYYGHVNPALPPAENFARVRRLAEFELRAYEASTRCLEAAAARLRADVPAAAKE